MTQPSGNGGDARPHPAAPSRARGGALALGCVALAAAAFAFYFGLLGDLPVGMEARDFLYHGGIPGIRYDARHIFAFEPSGNRATSMISFGAMAQVCGYRARCLNAIEILLIAGAGVLLLLHLVQLTGAVAPSLLAASLWCFSLPVLGAARWQATNHDKLALVFSLLAQVCASGLLRRRGVASVVASNLLLLPLFALAFESKESSFHLVATVPALLLLTSPRRGLGRLSELSRVALPLAWALVYFVLYFRRLTPQFQAHTLSGSSLFNLGSYAHTLANLSVRPQAGLESSGPVALTALFVLFALLLAGGAVVFRDVWRALRLGEPAPGTAREARTLAYLVIYFAGSLGIVLQTRLSAPFYLYTPTCAFFPLVVFGARSLLRGGGRRRAALALPGVVIAIGILVANFASNFRPGASSRVFLEQIWTVSSSYRSIRETLPCDEGAVYHFVLPDRIPLASFLFDHRNEEKDLILPFVLERPCEADLRFPTLAEAADRVDGEYYIELDRSLALQGIWRGRERLWGAQGNAVSRGPSSPPRHAGRGDLNVESSGRPGPAAAGSTTSP